MRRAAFLAAIALLLSAAPPPDNDKEKDSRLALNADFSALRTSEKFPEGANGAEKALHTIRKQLTGRDFYDPPNYMFFRQAVRSLGVIPAIFATADRILRDSRLGTVLEPLTPEDSYIHEGPEAYKPGKQK